MIARTITFANLTIPAMDQKLTSLVPSDFPTGVNGFALRVMN